MLHLFVTVAKRHDQPFVGIANQLLQQLGNSIFNIVLTEQQFKLVKKVEFSKRRWFRWWYYKSIFRELETQIYNSLSGDKCRVNIYLSDEGVWTECIKKIVKNLNQSDIRIVNVQHGIHFHETPSPMSFLVRKTINYLFCKLIGFPIFGLGMGGSKCDLYLTYTNQDQDFLKSLGLKAVVAGSVIKQDLIDKIEQFKKRQSTQKIALFPLQPIGKAFGFILTEAQYLSKLHSIAEHLASKHFFEVVFRPYPGLETKNVVKTLQELGFEKYGSIQDSDNISIAEALSQANIVLAHSSTVILDAIINNITTFQLLESAKSKNFFIGNYGVVITSPDIICQIDRVLSQSKQPKETVHFSEELELVDMLLKL